MSSERSTVPALPGQKASSSDDGPADHRALGIAAIDPLPDALLLIAPDGTWTDLLADAPAPQPLTAVPAPASAREALLAAARKVARTRRTQTTEYEDGDKPPRSFEARLAPTPTDHVVCVIRDVSALRAHAARAMHLDRMVAVGTLAAGVGHEINNPLSYVSANIDVVREDLAALRAQLEGGVSFDRTAAGMAIEDIQVALFEAREGVERITSIVRDLRTFSRSDDKQRPLDIERVIDSAIAMAFNEIRHRAELIKDYAGKPLVRGNESKLGQVFINLLVNAAHAIRDGNAETNEIAVTTRVVDNQVVICIRDTGCGIAGEDLPRIFDPFFTTKPVGEGTGLGLAICSDIVHAHGGEIHVDSEPGEGTEFRVLLPLAARVVASEVPARTQARSTSPDKARILSIDDEAFVARTVKRILGGTYEVTAVTQARQALDAIAGGQHFDLILCDLMMPEMSGMDFYDRVAEQSPASVSRIVFLTGGAFTAAARAFLERVPNTVLEKPITPDQLREFVAGWLADTATRRAFEHPTT